MKNNTLVQIIANVPVPDRGTLMTAWMELVNETESQSAQIAQLTAENERLKRVAHALLDKREKTEWTYEEAYDFTFKSWGREEWIELIEATKWELKGADRG